MVKGIGTDIIEIERIEATIRRQKESFLHSIFTEKERNYCERFNNKETHYAGRFAAKEAIVKALGKGFREGISWLDIEVLPDDNGKPLVFLSDKLKADFDNPHILLSISHNRSTAIATALWI